MMQFSVAPWRVLTEENQKICLNMANLHTKMGNKILTLAKESSKTGNPIVQPMAFAFPENNYEMIKDQFMLGSDILVAPVIEKGIRSRKVVLPEGKWLSEKGEVYEGGKSVNIDVPLERLPYFTRVKE